MQQRRQKYIIGAVVLTLCVVLYIVGIAVFAVSATTPTPPPTTVSPTSFPTGTPTASSVPPTGTQAPTVASPPVSVVPTAPIFNACVCGANEQPIYDTFPHPGHNDSSFIVINLYNDGGAGGPDTTVWITVVFTADVRMVAQGKGYMKGFQYVYLDAYPLAKGQFHQLTIHKSNTANGLLGGGRIIVYYRNPDEFDNQRARPPFNGNYPIQIPGLPPIPLQIAGGGPIGPPATFSQLLEATFDVVPDDDVDTKAFVDYDISGVDSIAMPVYIYAGYDRIKPGSIEDPQSICKKAYIGCATSHLVVKDCPTQVQEITEVGARCLGSFTYCQLANDSTIATSPNVTDKTRWLEYCHALDEEYAFGFGITQALIDLYNGCVYNHSLEPPCPPYTPPEVSTPTAVIYGGVGQFLLENHCLGPEYAGTKSRLDGAQATAINRGVCPGPNFSHIPLPDGLSCAQFHCPQAPAVNCSIFCDDYATCFGNTCADYSPFDGLQNQVCDGNTCNVDAANCVTINTPVSKNPRVATCNDSTLPPFPVGQPQNEYAAWARSKGQRFYAFSLDEEVGGGNLACLYSTQLDVVVFPQCNGNFSP